MSPPFRARPDGGVDVALGPQERQLLGALVTDLAGLLAPHAIDDPLGLGILTAADISDDPVLARLLPDAYADDEAANEFRRFTEQHLRSHKREALATMATGLGTAGASLTLDADGARSWLAGLNDLRLAVGTRLGIGADDAVEHPAPVAALYDWLTWLQDALIEALRADADTLPT